MEKQIGNGAIVKATYGHFIVLGFRTIGGEEYAQVKPFNIELKECGYGELALPLSILVAVG